MKASKAKKFKMLVESQFERSEDLRRLSELHLRLAKMYGTEKEIKKSLKVTELYEPHCAYGGIDTDQGWDVALKAIERDNWGGQNRVS